jgi:tRNA threonylcarbamoyladenosine biosynthesis protein TsaB
MDVILAMDASFGPCSVCVMRGGEILARAEERGQGRQAERLVPMIEQVLGDAALTYADLTLIATTLGPGSFTGIRIGLATARGIALAAGLPLKAYSSLQAMAAGFRIQDSGFSRIPCTHSSESRILNPEPCIVIHNAQRGGAYLQAFEGLIPLTSPQLCALDALPVSSHWITSDAGWLQGLGVTGTITEARPSAEAVAYLASRADLPAHPDALPLYLREADAKLPVQ